MIRRSSLAALLLVLGVAPYAAPAWAHDVRPASLEISEQAGGTLLFRWRQPVAGEYAIALQPQLSGGWLDREPDRRYITANSLIKEWQLAPDRPLAGQQLSIRGLERTITDVFITIEDRAKHRHSHLIKAATPDWIVPATSATGIAVPEYLLLGITHIWGGPDHLLYVLGLILLISGMRALILTISAFTLAHSITLAAASLGFLGLNGKAVEAVIALSILYVAVELVRAQRGLPGSASRRPWLIAMLFGLLHGFGFAGALAEFGLPSQAIVPALFLFNVGIELGQLSFVAFVLGVLALIRHVRAGLLQTLTGVASYAMGSIAAYWVWSRIAAVL